LHHSSLTFSSSAQVWFENTTARSSV